ncbi:Uncharacterised protein [Vibrio cholerae]|nr:Uncharacterised protein [Vibrio cholerae]
MVATWCEILAKSQHGDAMSTEIFQYFDDLFFSFTQAHHQTGFSRYMRMLLFKLTQQL